MVGLVLNAARHQGGAFDGHRLAMLIDPPGHHLQPPGRVEAQPREREATLGTAFLLLAEAEFRVDQMPDHPVDVIAEYPQTHPELGRSQTSSAGVQHGVGEIFHQAPQLQVEIHHRGCRSAQDRVAEESDGGDAHGAGV